MTQYNRTNRIRNAEKLYDITYKAFWAAYQKAFDRDDFMEMNYLATTYEEYCLIDQSFDMPSVYNDDDKEHPILGNSNILHRDIVADLVSFLIGNQEGTKEYLPALTGIKCEAVFDYYRNIYLEHYDAEELWHHFFLDNHMLRKRINQYRIHSLEELLSRAWNYYDEVSHSTMPSVYPDEFS